MAMFPCVVGNHRYSGPQRSVYLAMVNGVVAERAKLRLCMPHFGAVDEALASYGHAVGDEAFDNDDGHGRALLCLAHGEPAPDWTMFAAAYPQNAEPINRWGPICEECLGDLRQIARRGL